MLLSRTHRVLWKIVLSGVFNLVAFAQVSVLTSNYDNQRTNWNRSERILAPSNVNPDTFGKLGSFPVDGQIYAQPLYVSAVDVPGVGPRDLVYIATMHNTVYAFDVAGLPSTTPVWQTNLGPSVPSSIISNFNDIVPEIGILSTPVIDVARGAIYVVAETLENGKQLFRIHALSLQDGHEMFFGPTSITATVPGLGDGTDVVTFDPVQHLQRPGLAILNGAVYVAFGSHKDQWDWYGWLLGYDASDLRKLTAKFNAAPNGFGGAIWQSGRAPAIDRNGNLYVVTSNGDYDGQTNFSQSFLKLSTPALSVLDWYAPADFQDLSDKDRDMGSSGAILIPDTNLVVTLAKSGDIFMVNRDAMGHLAGSSAQRVHASSFPLFTIAAWNGDQGPMLYLLDLAGPLKGYRITGGQLEASPFTQTVPTAFTRFSGIAVSSNGTASDSAIVWQTIGDTSISQIPGSLHAFSATDLGIELWHSDMVPNRDQMGRFAKFVAPTVANGRVFVPTFSNQLVVYGPLSDVTDGPALPQIAAVLNGASFVNGPVAPGEIITIFGNSMGSPEAQGAAVNAAGRITDQLSDTQVFFDGIPAPLLYASAGQVSAIVPFGIQGPTVRVQVQYQGTMSSAVTVPVSDAAPALFALDGTGGGPGAILNEDSTVNDFSNPAERGSVIVLYGTGAGQTVPPGQDGALAGDPLPKLLLPVTVQIDGRDAEVLYAGPAPGQVQGVIQVNAKIPDAASSGFVPIVIKVGSAISPGTVSLVVR